MSDLHQGQTMTEAYRFISGGAAYTLSMNFQPDMVVFNNLTDWTGTAGGIPRSFWFRDETDAAEAYLQAVTDTAAAQSFNFTNPTTNGFTVADTSGGVSAKQATISGITQADPGVITHSAFTFQTGQIVRFTDLGPVGSVATDRGMDELNNNRYRVVVINATTFSLQDVITGEAIDTSAYVAYVSGGTVTLETNVLQLNNPQVTPYSATSPYNPNAFAYDPITYRLTAGTEVIGNDGDVFVAVATKFGLYENLGDIG